MRHALAVAGAVAAAAGVGAVLLTRPRRCIARSDDGTLEVVSAEIAAATSVGERHGMMDEVTDPSPTLREVVVLGVPALVLRLDDSVPGRARRLTADCGCRWAPRSVGRDDGHLVEAFPAFPRRQAAVAITSEGGAAPPSAVTVPLPVTAPPSSAGSPDAADELPVSVTAGDETWVLAPDPNPGYVTIRAVDATRRGFSWPVLRAEFRDASGNRALRPAESSARQHRIWLPAEGRDAAHLCAHEPWWELEIETAPDERVVFRFAPPRAE